MAATRITKRYMSLLTLVFSLLAISATEGRAELYGFQCITNSIATDAAIGEAQLTVDVSDFGNDLVLFRFLNVAGGLPSAICDVYFEDGSLLNIARLIDADDPYDPTATPLVYGHPGVDFSIGANPNHLPGARHEFDVTEDFDSDPPVQPNGVNPGEWLGIVFSLKDGQLFPDVISDLASGDLRIAIHVQGFASGGSESFINGPPVLPVPGAMLLGSLGLGVASHRLRRKRA